MPPDVVTLLQRGKLAQKANRLDDARTALEEAYQLAPNDREVLRPLANVYLAMGDTREARSLARRVRDINAADASADVICAEAYYQDGKLKRALHSIKKSTTLHPRDGEAWLMRGNILLTMGKANRANHAFHRAVENLPNNADALAGRAQTRLIRDNLPGSRADVFEALNIDPLNDTALNVRRSLRRRGVRESDLRRSPEEVAWRELERSYAKARNSTSPQVKADYLANFNANFAHLLNHEGAALERLAKHHAYLTMECGQRLRFNVKYHLRPHRQHTPESMLAPDRAPYAAQYKVADRLVIPGSPLQAYLLLPEGGTRNDQAIIVFRGTSPGHFQDRTARAMGVRAGLAADVDPEGVGYEEFQQHKEVLREWVLRALSEHRGITFVGHSLGGALASRLYLDARREYAAYTDYLRLATFNSPAIDARTVRSVAPRSDQVYHFITSGDPVHRAGECHLKGTVLRHEGTGPALSNLLNNHCGAPLSDGLLKGHLAVHGSWLGSDVGLHVQSRHEDGVSHLIESMRRGLGLAAKFFRS